MPRYILIVLLLIFLLSAAAQSGVAVRAPGLDEKTAPPLYQPLREKSDTPFKVGEKLVYNIHWMGIEAGTGVLEVQGQTVYQGLPAYHFVSTAQSSSAFSNFYPVNDRLDSFSSVEGQHSYLYIRHLREGFYKHDSTTTVDHQKGRATYKGKNYPTKAGVKDDLSCVYYFRKLSGLESGKTVTVEVFAFKKTWEVEAKILGKERVITPAGAFDTLKAEAFLKHEGIFQNMGRMFFWVTDDERRLPVMLKSEVLIGTITASLREYKLE